ncbi:MAG: helix-turn-helix domain-containing protein [Mycobacterium sp.]|nr:helix-turn-helix domain-containing protein [Mycobacterium sp.]
MSKRLTIDPGGTAESEWMAHVRKTVAEAGAAGEVVDLITRSAALTPAAVADRLGVSRSTISRKIKNGEIAAIRVGAHHRITQKEFERYRDSLSPEPLFTYRDFAGIIAGGEDWHFAARQLREVVIRSWPISAGAQIDEVHQDPGLTGVPGWDAIIGGVASISGRGRVSDPAILEWCFHPDRYYTGDSIFDPFDVPEKYFWTDYLSTPVELRVRNVVYPRGNIEGV